MLPLVQTAYCLRAPYIQWLMEASLCMHYITNGTISVHTLYNGSISATLDLIYEYLYSWIYDFVAPMHMPPKLPLHGWDMYHTYLRLWSNHLSHMHALPLDTFAWYQQSYNAKRKCTFLFHCFHAAIYLPATRLTCSVSTPELFLKCMMTPFSHWPNLLQLAPNLSPSTYISLTKSSSQLLPLTKPFS